MEVRYFETATQAAHECGFHLLLWPNAADDVTTLPPTWSPSSWSTA